MTPHLLPAMRNWILENDFIPEIIVDVTFPGTDVPAQYAKDNVLIISVSPVGCSHVTFTDEGVSVATRFNRVHTDCFIPYGALLGLRARNQPIFVPLNTQRVKIDDKPAGEEKVIDKIDVGPVEFGGDVRPSKGRRFGVVDGSKPNE